MTKRLALLVLTDGRPMYLRQTLAAFDLMVDGRKIDQRVIVDDAVESPDYVDWVDQLGFDVHLKPGKARRGFAGAIQAGWDALDECDYVLHLEDDFTFNRFWDVGSVMRFLDEHPDIAQVALRRQAWAPPEIAAGGVVEMWPDQYRDHHDVSNSWDWLEHDLFFTTNPSIYPYSLTKLGWPQHNGSEEAFTARLRDIGLHFAYWGHRSTLPWVHHIGVTRVGVSY